MKKIFALLISVLLVFSLVSCGSGKGGKVTSDVELLDTAGDRICYLFAPDNFAFHEVSADGGYNEGTLHSLETSDNAYEIEAGLVANSDSTLYDLFFNGQLTKTNYNGTEIYPDEVYKLETKEELDFDVAGNKVYYLERTISGEYFATYVVFEHTDKDGEPALYGVDLYSDDSDFYSKENSIKVFKDVYGVGRTKSAVYFGSANGEEDGEDEDTYGTLESVNMVYGSDELPVTIYKPERGTIELDENDAYDGMDFVWISSDDFEWIVDVFGAVSYIDGTPSHGFVDYYYNGELNPDDDEYEYFYADVYELDIEYGNEPVYAIEYTYAEADYPDEEETEYFVGVEFVDTYYGEYNGDGLLGFRYYSFDEEPTLDELASLFGEIFGDEPASVDYSDNEDDDWDYSDDEDGFDTDMIVGEWKAVESPYDEIFFFYASDYATYSIQGQEMELEYTVTEDGYLYLTFETGQEIDYTVIFDGSDTMYLVDVNGNEAEFERI